MAVDFPQSPSVGDTKVVGAVTWKFDGEKWQVITLDNIVAEW